MLYEVSCDAHSEREESHASKLKYNAKKHLPFCAPRVVTIANCRKNCKRPVDGKNVKLHVTVLWENIAFPYPRPFVLHTKDEPDASWKVREQQNWNNHKRYLFDWLDLVLTVGSKVLV